MALVKSGLPTALSKGAMVLIIAFTSGGCESDLPPPMAQEISLPAKVVAQDQIAWDSAPSSIVLTFGTVMGIIVDANR